LLRSVLSSIPLFALKNEWVPNRVLNEMEKIFYSFLWEQGDGKQGIHLVSWDKVRMPKQAGILEVWMLQEMQF